MKTLTVFLVQCSLALFCGFLRLPLGKIVIDRLFGKLRSESRITEFAACGMAVSTAECRIAKVSDPRSQVFGFTNVKDSLRVRSVAPRNACWLLRGS